MASQHEEILYGQSLNRSPSMNSRSYNTIGGIQRQTSRHFDNYGGRQPGLYSQQDDYSSARYDARSSNRLPPPISLYQTQDFHYDPATSPWAYHPPNSNAATMGTSTHLKPSNRRAPIPTSWIDPATFPSALPPIHNGTAISGFPSAFGGVYPNGQLVGQPHNGQQNPALLRPEGNGEGEPEELIPTAIVIKNIPFAVKKEQLQSLMQELGLPVPYAFNYHFDNGVFRGLAFANFQNAEDTKEVIETMNHMDLQGRKLRVEYKKMLPAAERDRIEREKRERRGQLEEQHRPVQGMTSLHNQNSMSSLTSALPAASPSPVSVRGGQISTHPAMRDVNMNDPQTLEYYSKLLVFKDAPDRKVMVFPSPLSPANRKILHALSHYLGLHHAAVGSGESRHIQIFKEKPNQPNTPDLQNTSYTDLHRRGLMRAATIDFGEAREGNFYHNLRSQGSGLLDIPGSPGISVRGQSLREAKSFGDLQNRQPSPALSSSSFPANLSQNVSRYTEYGTINSSGPSTTEATPTSAGNPMLGREEPFLVSSFTAMSLGFERQPRSNGRIGMNGDGHTTSAGAIGSQRPHNGHNSSYEDQPRNGPSAAPERQPMGPGSEWSSNFSRLRQNGHSGRTSDELDHHDPDQGLDRNSQSTSRYL